MSSAVARPMGTWRAQVGAETTLDTAASQTGSNNNMTEPAKVRNTNANLGSVVIEISKHVLDMEQAVIDGDLHGACYIVIQICCAN